MIILPDIHGRTFWKKAVANLNDDEKIIFLGDYMDPYSGKNGPENITYKGALKNFKQIIRFKLINPDKVILLLGNHDFHYMYVNSNMPRGCWRFDQRNWREISNLFRKYKGLFQMAYETEINGKVFIFTHAGIRAKWLNYNKKHFQPPFGKGLADKLNFLMKQNGSDFEEMFDWQVHHDRGGYFDFGSPIWADVKEHLYDEDDAEIDDEDLRYALLGSDAQLEPNVFQIFGHSQQRLNPIIRGKFACLDVRRPFRLNDETGEISEMNLSENKKYPLNNIINECINDYIGNVMLEKKGGIHIKKENEGKFTATKKKTGKSTEELTHSKNPLTRKRAIFAQNARKWNHKK